MENTQFPHYDHVHGAARSNNALKRTISKCSMDEGLYQNGSAAMKKLAQVQGETRPPSMFDDEPVLLPRGDHMHHTDEPEGSPPTFGWNDSPVAMKDRYYESIMESTSMASPSPHHIMYPNTPTDSASTVSVDSMGGYQTPHTQSENGDRECLSPVTLHAALLNYIGEAFVYYNRARTITFGEMGNTVRSVPITFRYIQGLVKDRLGISWHLVGSFVENVLDFISDEDIRDATVSEFAGFLKGLQESAFERVPAGNIFVNLYEFFREVLEQFKKYLAKLWVQLKRINFPCEFGKKSDNLFLCMECHREHL
jgi:hypothetical protein